jgi:two-component system response regulator DevR
MDEHTRKQGRISGFLVDDHEIFRRGVRALLADEPDIDVVGEAETASAAMARMPALQPDVAVLDVRLPGRGRHLGVQGKSPPHGPRPARG